jgi:hypothetical protein
MGPRLRSLFRLPFRIATLLAPPSSSRFYQAGARSPDARSTDFAALICSCSQVLIQPITEMNWPWVIAPLASAAFAEARRIARISPSCWDYFELVGVRQLSRMYVKTKKDSAPTLEPESKFLPVMCHHERERRWHSFGNMILNDPARVLSAFVAFLPNLHSKATVSG